MNPLSSQTPVIPGVSRSAAVERNSATAQVGTLSGGTPAATKSGNGTELKTSGEVSVEALQSELGESVRVANERLALNRQRLDIAVDRGTGSMVVTITDTMSGEIVKQIPSEQALRMMKNIDSLTGILVDHVE